MTVVLRYNEGRDPGHPVSRRSRRASPAAAPPASSSGCGARLFRQCLAGRGTLRFPLEPLVAWLHKRRVPRIAGAGLLLALILGFSGWGAYRLRDDAVQAIDALPEVARRARELVWSQDGSGPAGRVRQAAEELQRLPQEEKPETSSRGTPQREEQPAAGSTAIEWVQRGVGSVVSLAGHIDQWRLTRGAFSHPT